MKTASIACCIFFSSILAWSDSSHRFIDGFAVSMGKSYSIAVNDDEQSLTIDGPGGAKAAGKIFYSKASDRQSFDRIEYMKAYSRNFFSDKLGSPSAASGRVTVTVTADTVKRGFAAFWIVLKTADKREYTALAIDLTPSPGMASLLLLRVETGRPSEAKTVLARLLDNLSIRFLDAAG